MYESVNLQLLDRTFMFYTFLYESIMSQLKKKGEWQICTDRTKALDYARLTVGG